jgi:hypothetical protein
MFKDETSGDLRRKLLARYQERRHMSLGAVRHTASVLYLVLLVTTGTASAALPHRDVLGAFAVPADLDVKQISSDQWITVALPLGVFSLRGEPATPASGMTSLTAYSEDRNVRLYAFAADGAIQSAHLYGVAGHWQLVQSEDSRYWVPAAHLSVEAPVLAEPMATKNVESGSRKAEMAVPSADGTYEVRVLMLYTPALSTALGGPRAAEVEAVRLLELANGIYQANGVPARLVPAATATYFGASDSDFYADRDSMVGNPAVTSLRNQAEADLVILLRTPGSLCGLSSGFNGTGVMQDHSDPPRNVDPERDAFNIVAVGGGCGDDVLAHEIGHSFSAGHDWVSVLGSDGVYWKPYAHALPCPTASPTSVRYFSLMFGIGAGPGYTLNGDQLLTPGGRGDVITNPDALLNGSVCGSRGVEAIEATQADNVRAMKEAIPYVAAYRGGPKVRDEPSSNFGGALSSSLLGKFLMLGFFWFWRRSAIG